MRTFVLAVVALAFFSFIPAVFAQTSGTIQRDGTTGNTKNGTVQNEGQTSNTTNVTLLNPLKGVDCSRSNGNCLSAFLLNILDFVITIGSIVVILMLVYVGFKFVTAQGKPGEIDAAKQMLLWTIIGALILLGSKAIALGVEATVRSLGG